MAAVISTADMTIEKDSEIIVKVEEALSDLIVVSYCTENKKFQGVLLESNKGNLPFGVYSLHPAFNEPKTSDIKDDKLFSASQRFTYQEPQYATEKPQTKKPGPKAKPQRQKMTVRLRPRKVLCSNCQGVCNQNNENVGMKKRKHAADDDDITTETFNKDVEKKFLMGSMLIPKLSRLHPNEISSAIRGSNKHKSEDNAPTDISLGNHTDIEKDPLSTDIPFVNVTEDINMNCEQSTKEESAFNSMFSNAKTLKICFGEGEGTVVKIPPIMGDFNEDSGVCDMSKQSEAKAAKRAMRKAKKQAKKNVTTVTKDFTTNLSPKHIGALSPRNNMSDVSPHYDQIEKKHRHKVKHKKKHKLTKERDENTSKCDDDDSINYFSDIKDHFVNQKLSINLQRLGGNSYEKRQAESGSEGWESETEPDFPATGSEGAVESPLRVSPGDIVWGKVVGFPWWPGRVLSVTPTDKAHVAWFASTTSSLMPCDSLCPFLQDYKTRFNKKKKGAYKEAVKMATIEAKQNESQLGTEDPLGSPVHNLPTVSPRHVDVFS